MFAYKPRVQTACQNSLKLFRRILRIGKGKVGISLRIETLILNMYQL